VKLKGIYKIFLFWLNAREVQQMQEAACLLLLMHGKYFGSSAVQRCRGHSNVQEGNSSIKKKIPVFCPEM